ncbi:MAG: zf-TFIIB domain-containing protein [Cyanobacteria bacterium J06635_1]
MFYESIGANKGADAVRCPKDFDVILETGQLTEDLSAECCPMCQGAWIESEDYQKWQRSQVDLSENLDDLPLPSTLEIDYRPSPLDGRAGLCPNCGHYLVRGRINLRSTAFFVERCPVCKGMWCDRGEWAILEQLKLDSLIPLIFTDDWQTHIRAKEGEYREKQATIDKLGHEIAEKIFELANLLEKHPNGDFGVAYLMRRFET